MPQTPLTELNVKHKKFVKNLARTGNTKKAATLVGFSPEYGQKLTRDRMILTRLQVELDKQGLDDKSLVAKLADGLEAYYVKKDGGEQYPDFHAIQKMLDTIFKLRGDYAPEKHEITQKQVIIQFTPEFMKGLKDSKMLSGEECEIIESEALKEDE